MIKDLKDILVKYYKMIEDDKNKLIPYYGFYIFSIFIDIAIPLVVASITESITDSLYVMSLIMISTLLGLELVHTLFRYLDMYFYSNFFKANYITLYKKVINKLFNYSQEYQDKMSNGKIINSLTIDIVNIGEMADYYLRVFLETIKYIIISLYLIKLNYKIGLFILLTNIIYINLGNYYTKKANDYFIEQRQANDLLIGLMNQTIRGLKDIKTMNLSKKLNNRYQSLYKKWNNAYTRKRTYQIKRIVNISYLIALSKYIVYVFCIIGIINNKLDLGTLLVIISYFTLMHSSIDSVLTSLSNIREENVSLYRIHELLDYQEKNVGAKKIVDCLGRIEFKNVSFSYGNHVILKNSSFIIQENKITAFVGHNGAGKTTIINLLLRLNDVNGGRITLDDENIYAIEKESYFQNISILNQDTYFFNLSIRDNFNLIDEDIEKQEKICKLLGIDTWIKKLPNKYNTLIKEDSTNISGGQKRLLSLARTLLRGSKVIIFDEATANLDLEVSAKIIEVLKKLKDDHTIILATHKKDIMCIADEIIMIDRGKICGRGTHTYLIKNNKFYKKMYKSEK